MTRPARSRVRHGMASCTRYGCTRPECRAAYNRNRRQLNDDRARGITATVPADEAADWARNLILHGMPPKDIAARAGIYDKTITGLVAGRCERIYRDTADAILGVPLPPDGYQSDTEGLLTALGARRRLRALTARGFTLPVLAAEVGVTPETIGSIRQNRRTYVRISVHQAIAAAYERLACGDPVERGASPGGATRARKWAAKGNWPDPTWWEDYGGLDDPDAPETATENPTPRYLTLAEDGLWLERTQGYTRQQAADRLGVHKNALQAAIGRARRAEAEQYGEAA